MGKSEVPLNFRSSESIFQPLIIRRFKFSIHPPLSRFCHTRVMPTLPQGFEENEPNIRLEDVQWDALLLGVPKLNATDRRAFEAVLFVLVSGTPWQDLPEGWGVSSRTAWNRHKGWCKQGIWPNLLETFLSGLGGSEREHWERELLRVESARGQKHGRQKRLESLAGEVVFSG